MTSPQRQGRWVYLVVILVWAASSLFARAYGIQFDDTSLIWFWQYLDPEILTHDLLRGIWLLHSQPPLFNLFLGGVLQLFPGSSTLAFAVIFQGLALGLLIGMTWLMRRLGVPSWLAALLCALFAFHPTCLVYTRWLFYTTPIAFLLVASAVALGALVASGSTAAACAFSGLATLLMLSRAIFHPLWLVMVVAIVAPILDRATRRKLLAAAVAPLLLSLLWYSKNAAQVGSFGASSWFGMNLRRGWTVTSTSPNRPARTRGRLRGPEAEISSEEVGALLDRGALPPVWTANPFAPPEAYRRFGYFQRSTDPGESLHPAIAAARKSNGRTNYNHRDYARISREMLRGDLVVMREFPWRYLRRVATATIYFLEPGPRSVFGRYDYEPLIRLRNRWNRVLFLDGWWKLTPTSSVNLLYLLYPAVLIFGATRAFTGSAVTRILHAYISFTIVWFAASANLIEIGENDRMRFEVDPLAIVLLGSALAWAGRVAWRRMNGRSSAHAATPAQAEIVARALSG